jgi:hypothetical protein
MDFRTKVVLVYAPEFHGKRFKNTQEQRLSGQSYGADPALSSLTFAEFLDSFFGSDRLDIEFDPAIHEFELEHMGNVLCDYVIKP